jgi:ketosteroid isomerase-like protein
MKPFVLCLTLALCHSALAFESPQALQDGFMAALRANDADGMAACYTPDATSFSPDTMVGVGPDAVRTSKNFRVTSADSTTTG